MNHFVIYSRICPRIPKEKYDNSFLARVRDAHPIQSWQEVSNVSPSTHPDLRFELSDYTSFQQFAQSIGIMDDEKRGIPRTAYYGVVVLKSLGHTVFVVVKSLFPNH